MHSCLRWCWSKTGSENAAPNDVAEVTLNNAVLSKWASSVRLSVFVFGGDTRLFAGSLLRCTPDWENQLQVRWRNHDLSPFGSMMHWDSLDHQKQWKLRMCTTSKHKAKDNEYKLIHLTNFTYCEICSYRDSIGKLDLWVLLMPTLCCVSVTHLTDGNFQLIFKRHLSFSWVHFQTKRGWKAEGSKRIVKLYKNRSSIIEGQDCWKKHSHGETMMSILRSTGTWLANCIARCNKLHGV